MLGIGGLMGAGRSELAKGIFGFDRRHSGSVVHERRRPCRRTDRQAAIMAGIGFAPEDRKHEALLLFRSHPRQRGALRARPGVARGFFSRTKAMRLIVGHWQGKMSIKAPSLDTPVSQLSGGNQQKVVLARWLARQPMLLILDEPTRGIDIGAKSEIYRLIGELTPRGIGVILISSEMPELIGLADRVLVMAGGRVTGRAVRGRDDRGGHPACRHAADRTPKSKETSA